tara:strand:- start:20108 stop:20827 length:720 start_codon:yes stop_codon:yes gene_type:complete
MRKHLSLLLIISLLGSALISCKTTSAPRIPRNRAQPEEAREPLAPFWNRQANSIYASSGSSSNRLIGPDGEKIPRSVRRMQALEAKHRRAMTDPSRELSSRKSRRAAESQVNEPSRTASSSLSSSKPQNRSSSRTSLPPASAESGADFSPEFETSFSPATFNPADAIEETAPEPSSESTVFVPTNLPFAVPIPGKDGYVTLPRGNSYRGEIDVRGIGSGTPVEIPDPNSPGETVQFRVP